MDLIQRAKAFFFSVTNLKMNFSGIKIVVKIIPNRDSESYFWASIIRRNQFYELNN